MLAILLSLALADPTVADPWTACRKPIWPVVSRAADHAALRKDAGLGPLSSGDDMVLLYTAGGHHELYELSVIAVREAPGQWRVSRVQRVTSHIPPPPGSPPLQPHHPVTTPTGGTLSSEAAHKLEQHLQDAALYTEPASCIPEAAPPIGAAQEWLEINWQGRSRRFETFGVAPGLNGKIIALLWGASDGLK